MEAPKQIWMTDEWARQFDDKDFMGEDSVEYVRKDAFNEKAVNYVANYMRCSGYTTQTKAAFIRKYMEDRL